MLELSKDPQHARQQMNGLIFYLTTLSYIDGELDPSELTFIEEMIRKVIEARLDSRADPEEGSRKEVVDSLYQQFHGVLDGARSIVSELLHESVAHAEEKKAFVACKLKQRCFEILEAFDAQGQKELLAAADQLLMADGQAHASEVELRQELETLLSARSSLTFEEQPLTHHTTVVEGVPHEARDLHHPIFEKVEHHFPGDHALRYNQFEQDRAQITKVLQLLALKRKEGQGRLAGVGKVGELDGAPFLDGYVHVLPPHPGEGYDLTVVGDLHGCYSCAKAAIVQSRFFEKVDAYKEDPDASPLPMILFLGDYVDRGILSYEGVLRLALELFVTLPEHVVLLRGNHEVYVEQEGKVVSTVAPAEGLERLRPHSPKEYFQYYQWLFDALPSMVICGRNLFVHGGVPRDPTTREKLKDLSGLNDWLIRFQMMWSDPSVANVIPRSLQESTHRFGFGRLQCIDFLSRIGCHTLIRGHEHVESGFYRVYDDEKVQAITICSAGGAGNSDIPAESTLQKVRPCALTVKTSGALDGPVRIEPWALDYQFFCDPGHNGFLSKGRELP